MKDATSQEAKLLSGDVRVLGRWITAAEDRDVDVWQVLSKHYSKLSSAKVVGVTGPPGAGKSTLIDGLVRRLRAKDFRVGVLAVDPVSPYTNGAILGDRIRLASHFNDPKVFIRSVSTRGRLGGLSVATREAVHLMELAGFQWIFVETVGVGQSEVDVRRIADLTLVVLTPESGDEVQSMKAGLLEIGDLLVVNKAEREGATALGGILKELAAIGGESVTKVITTRADQPESVDGLSNSIEMVLADAKRLTKRRSLRSRETQLELVESWVSGRLREWMNQRTKTVENPYSEALDFTVNWKMPNSDS